MKLVIVESPTKAKTLNRFLGSGYEVLASMGHIRDLPRNKMNIDIEHNFKPHYELSEGKGKVVKLLQDSAQKAAEVYLAMDPDREGEAIAFHVRYILEKSKNKLTASKFKRISFHQITKAAVEEAIQNAGKLDDNLVFAQQARRVLDRLVGYSLSPVLWKKVRRGLSAGRVQSVALRLVVEREKEIEAFKAQEYWEIKVEVESKEKMKFWVDLWKVEGKAVVAGKDDKRSFLVNSKKLAEPIVADLKTSEYKVISLDRKEKRSQPKPPYTTSTLQQAAANSLGWTAKQTMRVAQSLYEKGLITYHRTDSLNLAPEAVSAARKYITKQYQPEYLPEKPRFYKTQSKNAQEAHEAIRPTDVFKVPAVVDGDTQVNEKKLYGLIWKKFVASQMTPAVMDATVITVEASGKKKYLLKATGSVIKFDGWRVVYGKNSKSQNTNSKQIQNFNIHNSNQDEDVVLPEVGKGEALKYKDLSSEQKFTQPPARYNDASLVKTLEQLGIGRPSTYAPTISTLIFRAYMERVDRRFKPTAIGEAVIEFLMENFKGIMDYGFTAGMEDDLDKIAVGKRKWIPVIREFWQPFIKKVEEVTDTAKRVKVAVEKTGRKCPVCGRKEGGEEIIRVGRFGKFLSCSRFPECKYTGRFENKVKGLKCPTCKKGDVVVKKTRKGRNFWGCNRYPDCDWASWTDPRKEKTKT